ncbi:hypothetical protein PT277_08015 [Acetobacteraceae bacterium ESL0709]|nr:hypothetical protein [Acetobacteraceae bacterium ESL0697]MDF7678625.1 hypothetical protein [Acetobacteraceae bacterium ESL0709]
MGVSSILNEAGRDIGQLAYVISPVILQEGIAKKMGGLAPILLFTEAIDFLNGMLSGAMRGNLNIPSLDTLWCHWKQGPTSAAATNFLIQNEISPKPMENLTAAGNAFNSQFPAVSLQMMCPARGPGAMVTKMATIMVLQRVLVRHQELGGRYIVMTPSYIWTDMVLKRVSDITEKPEQHPSSVYRFDFRRPITELKDVKTVADNIKKKYGGNKGALGIAGTGNGNIAERLLSGLGII